MVAGFSLVIFRPLSVSTVKLNGIACSYENFYDFDAEWWNVSVAAVGGLNRITCNRFNCYFGLRKIILILNARTETRWIFLEINHLINLNFFRKCLAKFFVLFFSLFSFVAVQSQYRLRARYFNALYCIFAAHGKRISCHIEIRKSAIHNK